VRESQDKWAKRGRKGEKKRKKPADIKHKGKSRGCANQREKHIFQATEEKKERVQTKIPNNRRKRKVNKKKTE